jgi:hypothetical protein
MAPPPANNNNRRALAGIAFLAACDAAYNAYGATNSSPQTTQLFAGERETTLMKWVWMGGAQAIGLTVFASWISRSLWPLIGGAAVTAIMHSMYRHAVKCGKKQAPPSNATAPSDPGGVSWSRP